MIPDTLAGWTYEIVEALCEAGRSESDRHDFKFDLRGIKNLTKTCCAFANSEGGFIILGVADHDRTKFEIDGLDPDKELYGHFLAKVNASPNIEISVPQCIGIPDSEKLLYVFEIPRSPRRPHLPTVEDERFFWKREGSDCKRMTLEEIRYQMNNYEEKREKLALLLLELSHIKTNLSEELNSSGTNYISNKYDLYIIDNVVVQSFSILKDDPDIISNIQALRKHLEHLNAKKQMMLDRITIMTYRETLVAEANYYRAEVSKRFDCMMRLANDIEKALREQLNIVHPYEGGGQTAPHP